MSIGFKTDRVIPDRDLAAAFHVFLCDILQMEETLRTEGVCRLCGGKLKHTEDCIIPRANGLLGRISLHQ